MKYPNPVKAWRLSREFKHDTYAIMRRDFGADYPGVCEGALTYSETRRLDALRAATEREIERALAPIPPKRKGRRK